MRTSRFRLLTLLGALSLIAAVAASTGGSTTLVRGKPPAKLAAAFAPKLDLSTYNASRWIVQLKGAPLASYGLGVGTYRTTNNGQARSAKLNASYARSTAYVSRTGPRLSPITTRPQLWCVRSISP